MKLNRIFLGSLIFMVALLVNIKVFALEGMVTGTDVYVRDGAGADYSDLGKVDAPSKFNILDENKVKADDGTDSRCGYWYKISYNDGIGYICSDFFTPIVIASTLGGSGNFLDDLAKFPSSYRSSITELHKLYPNATFTVLNTGLDWNDVVAGENYIASGSKIQARSLLEYPSDGYKSTNSIVYNWTTNVWNTNISGGSVNRWFAANENVIAYYLDPRNFLTYNSVFMFMNHGYNDNITYTTDAINGILSGSFMANSKTNDGVHTFADAFIDAGKKSRISPYYLATRVIQEIGKSTTRSNYVSGSTGYYNYYNIGATGSDNLTNALAYAKENGWDNDYKAIVGGALFISNGYFSTGQTTLYLEKFDVVDGGNGYYSHQYMQNVEVSVSEGNKLYKTYADNGLTNTSMEFLIPIYNNMPSSTSLPNKGNPNNYLKSITINGYTVSGFDMEKYEYNYNVSSAVSSVEIGTLKVANTSTVSGTGTIKLDGDNYKHVITVTAGNGSKKTYTINFTRDDSKPISVSDIVSTGGYVSDGTYISGISVGSSSDDLIKNLKLNDNVSVKVTDSGDKDKSGVIVTGDKVIIKSGDESKTYSVVIYGDVNGDSKIDKLDYLAILRHFYGYKVYSGAYLVSADVNRDGKVDKLDYLAVLRDFYGYSKIKQ